MSVIAQISISLFLGIVIGIGLVVLFLFILYKNPDWNKKIKELWKEWPINFEKTEVGKVETTAHPEGEGSGGIR